MAVRPDVSVIIPAFNAERTLARALRSALDQSHRNLEVIVVDDSSEDGTASVANTFAACDARVRVFSLPSNTGPSSARNTGIAHSRGEWIAILDADDAWLPERLTRLLALSQKACADLVFDNLLGIEAGTDRVTGPLFAQLPSTIDILSMIELPTDKQLDFGYLKPMLRAALAREAGVRYDETLRTSEDLLFYLELLVRRVPTAVTQSALYLYTLPITETGNVSPHSHTKPADLQVAMRLARFERKHFGSLRREERAAVARRADNMRSRAPLSEFYFARRQRKHGRMLAMVLTSTVVQREIAGKLWQKCFCRNANLVN